MKGRYHLPGLIVAAGLIAAGCGKEAPSQSAVGHDLPAAKVLNIEPGKPGGRLTLATIGAPDTFNPILSGRMASDEVIRLLFAPLVATDYATQELVPALAESWSVAADQKTWTFKLRAGLRWSDGQPLTAADVVFTWNEVMCNPDVNRADMNQPGYALFLVNNQKVIATKVDDVTVQMVTPEPFAPFLDIFGCGFVLPEHTFGPFVRNHQFLQAYSTKTRPERLVGAGPFRVKKIAAGDYVLLERNPEYWAVDKAKHRLPYFEEVMILATPANAPTAALGTNFLAGGSDVFERARPQDYGQFREAAKNGKINIAELGIGTERDFLWFNLNTNKNVVGQPIVAPSKLNWFQKKQFRQAVSCAIDRERIVREVYGGRAKPIHTFFTEEDKKWNNPDVPLFIYDPSRARTLLGEIGIKDRDGDGVMEDESGAKIEFTFFSNTGNPARERSATLIAEDLAKVGLRADLKLVHYTDLVERINRGFNYDCILMGLGAGIPDPASQIFVLKSSGQLHQWFPSQPVPATDWEARIDVLMDGQMRTLDFAVRKKLFDEVQAILAEQMPMIYTVAPFHFGAARADLANLRPSVLAPYRMTWNVEELYSRTNTSAARQ